MSLFHIIAVFTLSFILQTAEAVVPKSERDALLSIIQFADIEHQRYWSGASGTECNWTGVYCDKTQEHVIGLGISYASLTKLDSHIVQLTALKNLSLNGNLLTKLPPEIVQLTTLIDIDLSGNRLTEIPPEIFRMEALTHLSLDLNLLTVLSPKIGQLTALNVLRLDSNQLTTLPAEIGNLSALGGLFLQRNQLTELPIEIGKLKALDNLSLNSNQLTELPGEIGQLKALTYLSLSANQLTELPAEIGQLTALKSLFLYSNQLTKLPSEISQLTALTELFLNSNKLTELTSGIGQLTDLVLLNLDSNQLTKLPPEAGQLTSLRSLRLGFNQLTALPLEITQLVLLTDLDLESNQISALPIKLGQLTALTALTSLSLRSNQLNSLPPEIGQLTALISLLLDSNQLTMLPAEIGKLIELQELYLSKNLLSELPESLTMIKEKEDCVVLRGIDLCINVDLGLSENCLSETTLSDNLVRWLNSKKVSINPNWEQSQKDICINIQPIPMYTTVHHPNSKLIDFINTTLSVSQNKQDNATAFKIYEKGMSNRTINALRSGDVEQIGSDTWRVDTQDIQEGNYEIIFWGKDGLSSSERKGWSRSFTKFSNENNLADDKDLTLSFAFNSYAQSSELSTTLNLGYPLFFGDTSLIEKVKQTPVFSSLQFNEGYFYLNDSVKQYAVRPFKVETSRVESELGYLQGEDDSIKLITVGRRTISVAGVIIDLEAFKTALFNKNLKLLEINNKGLVQLAKKEGMSNFIFARPNLFSEPARISFTSPGLYLNPIKNLKNAVVAYYVYLSDQGQLVEQAILPTPYNWDYMKNELQDQGFTQITLAQDGIISASKNNILHRAFLSYEAKKVGVTLKTRIQLVEDLNGDGFQDAKIVYKGEPNQYDSWEQILYIFPENQGSN